MVGLGTIFIAILVIAAWQLLARHALRIARDAVDADARVAVSLYRQHRGMDHRGNGPPALADLRLACAPAEGVSPLVSAGNAWFTLIGFVGFVHGAGHVVFAFWSTAKSSAVPIPTRILSASRMPHVEETAP